MESLQSAGPTRQGQRRPGTRRLDKRVVSAAREAIQSGSLIPLLKEELWCKIQTRRLSEGQGELTLPSTPPVTSKLTPDDIEKRFLRRQQNKNAARRFRAKEKIKGHQLQQKISRLEEDRVSLEALRKNLRQEKMGLVSKLREHLVQCTAFDDVFHHHDIRSLHIQPSDDTTSDHPTVS
ncbi:cyclic AMP-dependent transcription factor ATF-3-like isoform X2 [Haliotis asinina]|uniref:cyclic AMP-dependent transcription factor ATF-3-like isoform X2 n=1 Tax=Haliotis asinina TaxID=109174 RepID=UPI0035326328